MGGERKVYIVLVGKTQRKETTRNTKKLVDGIRMDLRKTGWGWTGFDWLRIGTGGELL
jgi:hypothetical protein